MTRPPSMSTSHAVVAHGLTKRFGTKPAVDALDLAIPDGCTFGFIGPNGAGKSTTIRMLMGMLRITAGDARVLDVDVGANPDAVKRLVGYVPEQHFIYRWMYVHEVIGFCRSFYPTWNDALCAELIERFDLEPNKRVKHLSKGNVVKLALLLAIAHEPQLLLLDEPTSGLDPLVREEFLDGVLRAICDTPRTILFSSHTLTDVQRLADRIGIIHEGRLLLDCPSDELLTTTKRVRAVLSDGATPTDAPDGTVWQRVQGREWLMTVRGFTPEAIQFLKQRYALDHVEVMDLGLEDVFKDIVRGRRATA